MAGCRPVSDGGDGGDGGAGGGGDGGAGGGGTTSSSSGTVCEPGARIACYSGPAGTEGIGDCTAGQRTCNESGTDYGPCEGEVLPSPERCSTPGDEDCNGTSDEGDPSCVCIPGTEVLCYGGSIETVGVGACQAGKSRCNEDGSGFGPCLGQVLPAAETCATPVDDDCDGAVNEEGAGCVCLPGEVVPCYSGPPDTAGVGLCAAGTATCNALGTALGPCEGEVLPAAETCATPVDDDCDGAVNEEGAGCVCLPGEVVPCYSGPPGTAGVGLCAAGTATCDALGTALGPCEGEVLPAAETCATPVDDDCDGAVNEEGAGCACLPDQVVPCYSGPPGTAGVGLCAAGVATCDALGTALGPCEGEILPSVETCDTPVDDDCDGEVNEGGTGCAAGEISVHWAKRLAGVTISSVAVDAMDNTIVTGRFSTPVDFGAGVLVPEVSDDPEWPDFPEAFVAKYDPSGHLVFAKTFPGRETAAYRIDTDASGNIVLLGSYGDTSVDFGDGLRVSGGPYMSFNYLVKLNPSGNSIWVQGFLSVTRSISDTGHIFSANDIAVDGAGDVILVGSFRGTYDLGGAAPLSAEISMFGEFDAFAAKLSGATGDTVWSMDTGGPLNDGLSGVDVGPAGEIAAVGDMSRYVGPPSDDVMARCLVALKLGPAGDELSRQEYCNTEYGDHGAQVALDAMGDMVFSGTVVVGTDLGGGPVTPPPTHGTSRTIPVVAKFDDAGNYLWHRPLWPRLGVDAARNITVADSLSGTLDFGVGTLSSAGSSDVCLVKLDPGGNLLASGCYGDASSQTVSDLAVSAGGSAVLAGSFAGTLTFGSATLVSETGQDAFLVKVEH
ncbi:MopE-related protein [Sorangium sp. So ce131]|uniref:MopE-related protein n=1 Tax=Sorangium sp. So ce131 TaxID=3133282 RepID=UPI003F5E0DD2